MSNLRVKASAAFYCRLSNSPTPTYEGMKAVMRKSLLIACLLCTACAAGGTQVKESQLRQFTKGKTTDREVVAALGDPNTNSLLPDGSRLICYTYMEMATRPETFIPIVGGFIGGADSHSNSTCFQFADNGVLKGYSANSSQIGAGSMFASGVHGDQRVKNEPRQAD